METFEWQTLVAIMPSICPIAIDPQSVHAITSVQQISVREKRGSVSM